MAESEDTIKGLRDELERAIAEALSWKNQAESYKKQLDHAQVHSRSQEQRLMRANDRIDQLKQEARNLEYRAEFEPVTGLLRREVVDRELRRVLEALDAEERARLAVLYLDIDDFSVFNDRFGHEEGDSVLRFVAEVILQNIRPGDFAGRGDQGDEFVILLRDSSIEEARVIGEQISSGVARRKRYAVATSGMREHYNITISVGAAASPGDITFQQWKTLADADMYENKRKNKGEE